MTTILLVNPAAGRGRAKRLRQRALAACRRYWGDLTMLDTTGPGSGVAQVRQAVEDGAERILVLGGDGAVHEAANGLLTARRSELPALGVLPAGTGNDYAKLTGISGVAVEEAARRLSQARVRYMDVGRVQDEYFVNAIGVGFDADVARRVNGMRLRGPLAYLVAVAQGYRSFQPLGVRVTTAEERFEEVILLLEVGIGAVVGGGFRLNPGARPDDGLLDVCVIRRLSGFEFITRLPLAMLGWHTRLRQVRCFRATRVVVEATGEPVLTHFDGEVRSLGRGFDIALEAGRLPVLCP